MILRVVMEKMIVEVVVIVMKEFELRSDVYVDLMIRSGYEKECCQVYCNIRRDVLDECLSILGVGKVSVEEMQRMECKLCGQVLSESELIKVVWASAGERVGRGWKRWEDIRPCLRGEEYAQRFEGIFFNEMSSKKQTVCRAKRPRMICAAHT
ncbi:putative exocyst complex component Exo70, cullin repeat-like-containing domain superfamily [Helianthus anomalus]